MKNVAFVTYNTVGNGLLNGWHDGLADRRALLVQNTKGARWGASEEQVRPALDTPEAADRVRGEISNLWGELQTALPELDHVVIYVGASGSERAIALAAQLPATKVTFVGCDCGLPHKEALIRSAGMTAAQRVLCECGGHRTMERLYLRFMETGELLSAAA